MYKTVRMNLQSLFLQAVIVFLLSVSSVLKMLYKWAPLINAEHWAWLFDSIVGTHQLKHHQGNLKIYGHFFKKKKPHSDPCPLPLT